MGYIYLDNGATTKVAEEVASEISKYFTESYGNASSNHLFGELACEGLERARIKIAKALNAEPDEIIFTSGGTESDNLAIRGLAEANKDKGNHIITSAIEHPAVLNTCRYLERNGFEVTYLPVDEYGFIDMDELRDAIRDTTILVTIMTANNEIGTIASITEIGEICRQKNVNFHTDSVQAFTKVPIDVKKQNIDLASLSAHKIHGPKGIGALFIKKGTKISPIQFGGSQEHKLRPGTENVAGIVGFAKAVEIAQIDSDGIQRISELRDKLIEAILQIEGTRLNGHPTKRLCINANISFTGIEGERLLYELNKKGICASTGSACSAKSSKPSHVLTAIGIDNEQYPASIRFTLSRYTTEDEIDYAIETVREIVQKLRQEVKVVTRGC